MVTFVPDFVSQAVADHSARVTAAEQDFARRFPNDAAARRQALAEWRRANPAPRATLAQVADHVEHIRRIAGVEHVGIGSDFDGISTVPDGLEDVSTFPALFAELARRGWTERELRLLSGENVLRVMRRAEAVAARLRQR